MALMILQTLGIISAAWLAAWAGWRCARLKKYWWTTGYIVGLVITVLAALPHYIPILNFIRPFSWLVSGRTEFALVTLVFKTDKRTYRIGCAFLSGLVVFYFGLSPFGLPLLHYNKHQDMQTEINPDGVCMQTTGYTCGPAASVTALRGLEIAGEEGRIAIACATTPTSGTQPDSLRNGLEQLYGNLGLYCEYRFFEDLDGLAEAQETGITVAVIKYGFMVDHYVTILQVREDAVVVGDPLQGIVVHTREHFSEIWRKTGVVCRRGEYL
ncbi:cysteine peptidase family C39 domain-containing protein [Planctomycetota bacterium]